jgi:hypothetical protein
MAEKERSDARGFDFAQMARFYKESSLQGLELALKGQEETEKASRNAAGQAFAVPKEWLKLSRQWLQAWDEIAGMSGTPNPWLTWSKQCTEACCAGAEPMLKAAEETFQTGYTFYEGTLAGPSRRYLREFSRRFMEAVIPG